MFQGFTTETVDFMWGVRFNNDRTWFEIHKAQYKACFEAPMKELCRDVSGVFCARHEDLGLMSRVSRIYRDARRLRGRGPYRDNLWFTLAQPGEEWSCQPVFWFELDPEEYSLGLGYWTARASTMAKFRARMDRDPKTMEKLVRQVQKLEDYTVSGEDFKRRRTAPSALLEPWYNKKKGFSVSLSRPHDERIFSPELPGVIAGEWEKLVPLFRYLSTLDGDPDPREA